MFGTAIVAAFAIARLATGATTATLFTAAIGALVVAALRHRPALGIALGVVLVAASALWWGLHAISSTGVPTSADLQSLRHSLQASRSILLAFDLPLVRSPGITVLCALLGGLAAVAGRTLASRAPALSLVPGIALLVSSAILIPTLGSAAAGLILGGCGFLVLSAGLQPSRRASAVVAGCSLALASSTLGWSAVAGSNVASPGGKAVPQVAPSALSLATNLTGVESQDAQVVLFQAKTHVATYWQVTNLTTFVDDRWIPDQEASALLHGRAPVRTPELPTDSHLFGVDVTLFGYSGQLLPVPPATIAASGTTSPVITTSGVVASVPVHLGSSYSATAIVPSPVDSATSGTPSPSGDTQVGQLPAAVDSLALSITASQTSALDKAEALTDFFRSGRFHYRVTAIKPSGTDPLVTFLTQTRTGSCEQFASAFAVLARVSGLASRVAIGFTPGREVNGVTIVRGSDAHAWPQVLIDGSWVSFEPTPQLPSGELSPPGILGPAALGQANPIGTATQPRVPIPVPIAHSPAIPPPPAPTSVASHAGEHLVVVLSALVLTLAIATTWLAIRRRMRQGRRAPVERVLDAWMSIERALVKRNEHRPVWQTPMGFVNDLSHLHQSDEAKSSLEDMNEVAILLQRATYGTSKLTSTEIGCAERAAHRARRAILAGEMTQSRRNPVRLSRHDFEFIDS